MIAAWNRFFFSPMPLRTCAVLRIAFGVLMLINCLVIASDAAQWFGPDGPLPFAAGREIIDPDTRTLFQLWPESTLAPTLLAIVMVLNAAALTFGWHGRVNAACLFVLFTSFHHRNLIYFDSEDTLLQLACFFLIFMPVDAVWSIRATPSKDAPIWPLRLLQFEMSLIYLSTAVLKFRGLDWPDGTALHYALGVEMYQRFPLPAWLTSGVGLSRAAPWLVLALEAALPVALWLPRTRRAAVIAGIALHLGIDYSMNLFLFEWAMIAGLLAFWPPRPTEPTPA